MSFSSKFKIYHGSHKVPFHPETGYRMTNFGDTKLGYRILIFRIFEYLGKLNFAKLYFKKWH